MSKGVKIFDLARWPFVACFIGFLIFLLFNCNLIAFTLTRNVSPLSTGNASIVSRILLSPLAFNIFGGIVASFTALLIIFIYKKISLRKAFSPLEGDYRGYNGENFKEKEIISKAKITYQKRNLLGIKVYTFETKEEWEGVIIMNQEYIDAGNIMWKYKKPKHIGHKFGFKRCMIRRLGKDTIIYVAGESLSPEDDNYGKEIFKKIHQ